VEPFCLCGGVFVLVCRCVGVHVCVVVGVCLCVCVSMCPCVCGRICMGHFVSVSVSLSVGRSTKDGAGGEGWWEGGRVCVCVGARTWSGDGREEGSERVSKCGSVRLYVRLCVLGSASASVSASFSHQPTPPTNPPQAYIQPSSWAFVMRTSSRFCESLFSNF
jgi:hypothetical protein